MDKTGKRTAAQISKNFINFVTNKLRSKSLTSAHVIILHGAEVNIPIGLSAEVTSVPKLLVPIINCPNIRHQHRLFGNLLNDIARI